MSTPSGSRKRRSEGGPKTSGGQHCPLFPLLLHPDACGLFPDQGLNLHLLQWKRRGTTGPLREVPALSLFGHPRSLGFSLSPFLFPHLDTCLLHHFSSRFDPTVLPLPSMAPSSSTHKRQVFLKNEHAILHFFHSARVYAIYSPPMLQLLRRHFHLDISL